MFFANFHFMYCTLFFQHCFICCPSDSTVSDDAGTKPWPLLGSQSVRSCNHLARSRVPFFATFITIYRVAGPLLKFCFMKVFYRCFFVTVLCVLFLDPLHGKPPYVLPALKVLSSEMDLALCGLIRKDLIKGRGEEILSKFRPPHRVPRHLVHLLTLTTRIQIANSAHSSVCGLLFTI